MKPLVMLDLDDTLLSNKMETFLPVYIKKLGKKINDVPHEIIARELISATQKMVEKDQPRDTLEQTFDEHFYPAIGLGKEELSDRIHAFYRDNFPEIQFVTQKKPEAVILVNSLIDLGYPVAIATNPLFPKQAVLERLRWAGIPTSQYNFNIITSYENFHFAKSDPAYYTEILAQLEWKYDSAVMIGNDWKDDIQSASRAGLATYWLSEDNSSTLPEEIHPLSDRGSFEGILPWIESINKDDYEANFNPISSILALLKSTPAALDTICRQLQESQWKLKPAEGEWSITEVLCHLRDVDKEVNLPRVQILLENDNHFFPGKSTDTWADERRYFEQDGKQALFEFIESRSKIIKILSSLQPQDWNRKARHAIFGPTTLKELISFITTHDRVHIQQICDTKKLFYKELL